MRNLKWWFRRHEIILTLLGLAGAALALFVVLTLAGCQSPTTAPEPRKMYVVNSLWQVVKTVEGISRQDIIDNIVGWRNASAGQILFIDHVPPLPIVIPPPSMYAWYSLYVIDDTGAIVYEDHSGWLDSEVWDGQWILDAGWRNADHYYETTRRGFWNEVVSHAGWTLVEHQLYTEPTP